MASVRGQIGRLHLWGWYAAGATLGGATTGALLAVLAGLASPLPGTMRLALAAAAAVAFAGLDLASPKLRLPQRTELIPQTVFDRGMSLGIARFAYEYGTGLRTLVPSAASYLTAVFLMAANLPWWQTVLAGAVFGLSRSIAVLQYLLLGDSETWAAFLSQHTRVLERAGSVLAAVLVIAAVAALWP
ncbi:hypothetical protein ACQP1U_05885 [Actinomycetota bacterium]